MSRARLVLLSLALVGCERSFLHGLPAALPANLASCADFPRPDTITGTVIGDRVELAFGFADQPVDRFEIERNFDDQGWLPLVQLATTARGADFELPADTRLALRVHAVAGACTSEPSEAIAFYGAARAPVIAGVTASTSSVDLALTDDNHYTTGLRVWRAADGEPFTVIAELPRGAAGLNDAGVYANRLYHYRIEARHADDPARSAVAELDRWTPPLAPSAVMVSPLTASKIALAFADPNDGPPRVAHIERRTLAGAVTALVSPTPGTLEDSGLDPGATYTYDLWLENAGAASAHVSLTSSTLHLPQLGWSAPPVFDAECGLAFPYSANADTAAGAALVGMPSENLSGALTTSCGLVVGAPGQIDLLCDRQDFVFDEAAAALSVGVSDDRSGSAQVSKNGRVVAAANRVAAPAAHRTVHRSSRFDASPGRQAHAWGQSDCVNCAGEPLFPGQIAAADNATCVIGADARAYCFGDNAQGQLGISGPTNLATPTAMQQSSGVALDNVHTVSLGIGSTCVIKEPNGRVRCVGDNSFGQAGIGTAAPPLRTTLDADVCLAWSGACTTYLSYASALSSGEGFHCALLEPDGSVWCWGDRTSGRLGSGGMTGFSPIAVATGITGAVSIASGYDATCAVLDDGRVRCFGNDTLGRLATSTGGAITTPQPMRDCTGAPAICAAAPELAGVVAVAIGETHSCTLHDDGSVRCRGADYAALRPFGMSGADGITAPLPSPAIAISAGRRHQCALLADSTLDCWGEATYRKTGHGGIAPALVPSLPGAPAAVALGGGHTCSLQLPPAQLPQIWCFGANDHGQLGRTICSLAACPNGQAPLQTSGGTPTPQLEICRYFSWIEP